MHNFNSRHNQMNQKTIFAVFFLIVLAPDWVWGQSPVREFIYLNKQPIVVLQKPQPRFVDVSPGDPYYDLVHILGEKGVVAGCPDYNLYCPNQVLTRGQIAALVVRAVRVAQGLTPEPPASTQQQRILDVGPGHWAYQYVQALAQMGLTNGCDAGTIYCPDASTKHEEIATLTVRAYELVRLNYVPSVTEIGNMYQITANTPSCFADVYSTDWYFIYVQRTAQMGILNQSCGQGNLPVNQAILRGAAAFYIARGMLRETAY